ncbi:MAG: GNAT family N-acetyltransferase, partial [Gemmobacter sp.]|nr:GNAT family N-acetyltransferase [Gemmobacter sp.]
MAMTILRGLPEQHRAAAARLYWQAFGDKLGRVMGPEPRALDYLCRVIRADHALVAVAGDELLGFAGFKSPGGGFAEGGWAEMRPIYGLFGAGWRLALLGVLSRQVDNERFLVDGICVIPGRRGEGIGSQLVAALCAEAALRGYRAVRLDVIDRNTRARALYERLGFRPVAEDDLGLLRLAFG